METSKLKKFAQEARQLLLAQILARVDQVLAPESAARREAPKAVQRLESEINRADRAQVVEKVAYTWFNRFTALRFMDVNDYTSTGIVSPAEGRTRPEILADAAAGIIDDDTPSATKGAVLALLEGRTPSQDAQGEAYRLLLVASCNHWHAAMPFLFEKIADYTELLMPADLLSSDSILAKIRAVMTTDACKDVEIIAGSTSSTSQRRRTRCSDVQVVKKSNPRTSQPPRNCSRRIGSCATWLRIPWAGSGC